MERRKFLGGLIALGLGAATRVQSTEEPPESEEYSCDTTMLELADRDLISNQTLVEDMHKWCVDEINEVARQEDLYYEYMQKFRPRYN